MRMTALLLLVFAVFPVAALAEDQPPSTPAAHSSQFDLLKRPTQSPQVGKFKMPSQFNPLKPWIGKDWDRASETCYVMDTYVMRREDRDSDSTRPAGHSTCLPSSMYSMKDAVVVLDSSSTQ